MNKWSYAYLISSLFYLAAITSQAQTLSTGFTPAISCIQQHTDEQQTDDSSTLTPVIEKADSGNAEAQFQTGNAYAKGAGITQDNPEAVRWWRRAAEQGHARAQNALALAYSHGPGAPRDQAEAARWYKAAAEQGLPEGLYNLGYVYEHGLGVAQNHARAAELYQKSAAQGFAPA